MTNNTSVIVKVSGKCNLDCKYCYYYLPKSQAKKKIMNLDLAQRVIIDSSVFGNNIELIWHGGEPLLAGTDFFKAVIELEKTIERKNGIRFSNRIQTNATLIDQEWIDIFKIGNFGVGVSLDGYEELHNQNRIFHNGKGSFHEVVEGIGKLQKAGISFSILAVLTKKSLQKAKEIYDFFSDSGFERFDFLPSVEIDNDGNIIPGSLDKGDFANFMGEIFDIWFSRDDSRISIRYFEQFLAVFFGNSPSLCKMNGTCQEYITIDYNGDVYSCDNFIGYPDLKFGNLSEKSLKEIINTNKVSGIKQLLSQPHLECQGCFAYRYCNGGCNKYRYIQARNFSSPFYFCEDTRLLLRHVKEVIISEHPLLETVY